MAGEAFEGIGQVVPSESAVAAAALGSAAAEPVPSWMGTHPLQAAPDPVHALEKTLKDDAIDRAKVDLQRLVNTLDSKTPNAPRVLRLIESMAKSYIDMLTGLCVDAIPRSPRQGLYSSGLSDGGLYSSGSEGYTQPMNNETYGAQMAQQMMTTIKQSQGPQAIKSIVGAIANAREAGGMEDTIVKLQAKLDKMLEDPTQGGGV